MIDGFVYPCNLTIGAVLAKYFSAWLWFATGRSFYFGYWGFSLILPIALSFFLDILYILIMLPVNLLSNVSLLSYKVSCMLLLSLCFKSALFRINLIDHFDFEVMYGVQRGTEVTAWDNDWILSIIFLLNALDELHFLMFIFKVSWLLFASNTAQLRSNYHLDFFSEVCKAGSNWKKAVFWFRHLFQASGDWTTPARC